MKAGQPHRLRFINILAEDDVDVALLVGDTVGTWRAVAKDGATHIRVKGYTNVLQKIEVR